MSDKDKINYFQWGGCSDGVISNFSNFIIACTDFSIKIWDVEFSTLKWKISIKERY